MVDLGRFRDQIKKRPDPLGSQAPEQPSPRTAHLLPYKCADALYMPLLCHSIAPFGYSRFLRTTLVECCGFQRFSGFQRFYDPSPSSAYKHGFI